MNEFAKKYEAKIKKFLADKLKKQELSVERINEIVTFGAEFMPTIQNDDHIEEAFHQLSTRFEELRILDDGFHMDHLQETRVVFEKYISELTSVLIYTDLEKTREILAFTANRDNGFNEFLAKYPEYQQVNA